MFELDVPTLMLMGAFVALLSAVLLTFGWMHFREDSASLSLAGFNFCAAVGIVLLTMQTPVPPELAVRIGLTSLVLAYGLAWHSIRTFERRPAPAYLVVGGAAIFLVATAAHPVFDNAELRFGLNAGLIVTYTFAAAFELLRDERERLWSRRPMAVLFVMQGLLFLGELVSSTLNGVGADGSASVGTWFGLIHFQFIVFSVATASFFVSMRKDRRFLREERFSRIDSLTGLANRGAFIHEAAKRLRRASGDEASIALALFDLDHFKSINDVHGHQMGDKVLKMFGEIVLQHVRPTDLAGRFGGEEFALLMPGANSDAGLTVADRIRAAFAKSCAEVDGIELKATVSAGIAVGRGDGTVLEDLVEVADSALYRAKGFGRNRVVLGKAKPVLDGDEKVVVRVA